MDMKAKKQKVSNSIAIEKLMAALPVSGIESQWLACIEGFLPKNEGEFLEPSIIFFEPPAGQNVPYLDPIETMIVLFRDNGKSPDEARALAVSEYAMLRPKLPLLNRPLLCQGLEVIDIRECVPVNLFIEFVRKRGRISEDFISFLETASDVVCRVRTFRLPDDWYKTVLLSELPSLPPPKAMIEYFVGLQSDIGSASAPDDPWKPMPHALFAWREAMRPIAANLEQVVGEKVYHFKDLDDELDDDCCHRFLALHCWCSLLPESNFVKYLLEVTGFTDVEALKAALIDPTSYTHPFVYNNAFVGIETRHCRLRYLPPGQKKRVGIAFRTEAAKQRAKEIALEQIGADILFLAPMDLATKNWMQEATIYNRVISISHVFDRPIAFLAGVYQVHVVSDDERPNQGFNLMIGPELEILMWRAHQLGVKMFSDSPSASILANPETCLEASGVPERVAAIDARRRAFTEQISRLHVEADYGSSGLWSNGNVCYDLIDLPFPLIRRIADWQCNYDDTLISLLPETAGDEWWEEHFKEKESIVRAIKDVVGVRMIVD